MRNFSSRELVGGIIGLFVFVGFLVYGYSVWNNEFISFDDGLLIYDNISVIRAGTFWSAKWAFANYDPELYIPLTFLSLQLDAIIGGLNPFIFHLNNLLLHIGNALLITWIIRLLFKHLDIAVILGLLFLVHPLNVETVAWAASRKDVLSSFFFLATIVGYLRYLETGSNRLHCGSIGIFVLGLLSKVSIIPLPAILLCIDWYKNGTVRLADVWQKKGYIIAAIPFGLLALLGKDVVLVRSSPISIALLVPKTTFFYLQKILLPTNLSIFYSINPAEVSLSNPSIAIPIVLMIVFAAALLWWRKKIRTVLLGVAIMFAVLIPSFFQYYRGNNLYFATDRYMYAPFLGVLIALASLMLLISERRRILLYVVSGMALIAFGVGTFYQSQVWENTYVLFTHALNQEESFLAYEKIGAELLDQGRTDEAIIALKRSIELAPNSAAYMRLGIAASAADLPKDAKEFYKKALELSPDYAQAHTNIGQIYWNEGRQEKAIEHTEEAVKHHGWNMMALGNLASMYALTGKKEKAFEVIEWIIELDPDNDRVGPLLKKLEQM